jgi:ATP-binding cassette, subfamily G (WHITE), member 2, PDR
MHSVETPAATDARRDYFLQDDRAFEPIRTFTRNEDAPELAHLASLLSRSMTKPATRDAPVTNQSTLQRKDTLAGLEATDSVFQPNSSNFDFYKWMRMFMVQMENDGLKHRRSGFTFKDLTVTGTGNPIHLQSDVGALLMAPLRLRENFRHKAEEKKILRNFNGRLKDGEMLIVLGKPGSGCTTFLKTMTGETKGLSVADNSVIHYNGIPQDIYKKELRGDVCYNAETDQHFPHLTVGETLEFAAKARTPSTRVKDLKREEFAKHIAAVVMAIFGLSHTYNTKVGNDYVRGVSGGERKRVSIAEMALSGSPICCWDNSTRGLDAATALEFTRALRVSSNVSGGTHAVAIYQASQAIYDLFDKAIVLYEGRQIYYGPTSEARKYFEDMGWYCPPRQTTGDFLTSVTNPTERKAREGFDSKVPRTPDEFEKYWLQSENAKRCLAEIQEHEKEDPVAGSETLDTFREAHHQAQAKHVRPKSPYVISIPMQIRLCTTRAYQRIWNDKTSTITVILSQIVMSLIIASIFYGTPNSTGAFFSKGSILFFAILLSALNSITEINGLYEQRPIVERHVNFAFYHAFSEAIAGIVSDVPIKFIVSIFFNVILYFLGGLKYQAGAFFLFWLFTFVTQLTMSAIFRTLAAATKQISQALAFAGIMVLAIVIYTGFTIQRSYMHPWYVLCIFLDSSAVLLTCPGSSGSHISIQ